MSGDFRLWRHNRTHAAQQRPWPRSSWTRFLWMMNRPATSRADSGQKTPALFSGYLRMPARHKSLRAP
jgi:hypothetical protein